MFHVTIGLHTYILYVPAHTPDNTFLGFAVVPAEPSAFPAQKENWGLLYGKKQDYFTVSSHAFLFRLLLVWTFSIEQVNIPMTVLPL